MSHLPYSVMYVSRDCKLMSSLNITHIRYVDLYLARFFSQGVYFTDFANFHFTKCAPGKNGPTKKDRE